MTKRNPVAQDLRSPKYKVRVVKSEKAYTRKKKHKKGESHEIRSEGS